MTEKLYNSDSHLAVCTATVRACEPCKEGFAVLLDQTILFPAGGGQPTDLGTVGDATVLACRDEGEEVVHLLDRALAVGKKVTVSLNWPRRFDYMQQHTGEHLLSFAFYKLFGVHNVGFHLADTYTTIDFDNPLNPEAITQAEMLANSYVWRNLSVTATLYPDEAAITRLPLRKHAEGLVAPIRIVQITDADCCTCCAPHCKQTGEIGLISIVDAVAYKGGTRITFLCGKRALVHARVMHNTVDRLARRFSVSRDDAEAAVIKLNDDFGTARRSERQLTAALNSYMAEELAAAAVSVGKRSFIIRLLPNVEPNRLKDLAQAAGAQQRLVVLLSEISGKLAYVLSSPEGFLPDVGDLIQAVNAATGGKGGGRGTLAQGLAQSSSGAKETVEQLKQYLLQRLK
ncbi:MAG: alanyl-tRNA editing protein [Clostridia bacterium]